MVILDTIFDLLILVTGYKVNYLRYIHSARWHRKAARARQRAGNKCHDCGAKGKLEVHHKTYARLGHELWFDLVVLCHACHEKRHKRSF